MVIAIRNGGCVFDLFGFLMVIAIRNGGCVFDLFGFLMVIAIRNGVSHTLVVNIEVLSCSRLYIS
jgi:hypothetical protein